MGYVGGLAGSTEIVSYVSEVSDGGEICELPDGGDSVSSMMSPRSI